MTWRRRPKWRTTKDVSRIVDDDDITAREIDWIKAFTDNDTVYAWLDDGCTVQGGGGGRVGKRSPKRIVTGKATVAQLEAARAEWQQVKRENCIATDRDSNRAALVPANKIKIGSRRATY